MAEEKTNEYIDELKKFLRKQVKVTAIDGTIYEGECRAIDFIHLNVILMTDTEKYVIKNIRSISRPREHPKK